MCCSALPSHHHSSQKPHNNDQNWRWTMILTSGQVHPLQLIDLPVHKELKKKIKKRKKKIIVVRIFLFILLGNKGKSGIYRVILLSLNSCSVLFKKTASYLPLQRMLLTFRWKVTMIFTEQNRCYLHVLQKTDLLKESLWTKPVALGSISKELAQSVLTNSSFGWQLEYWLE